MNPATFIVAGLAASAALLELDSYMRRPKRKEFKLEHPEKLAYYISKKAVTDGWTDAPVVLTNGQVDRQKTKVIMCTEGYASMALELNPMLHDSICEMFDAYDPDTRTSYPLGYFTLSNGKLTCIEGEEECLISLGDKEYAEDFKKED